MQHGLGAVVRRSGRQQQSQELPDSQTHCENTRRSEPRVSETESRSERIPEVLVLTNPAEGASTVGTTASSHETSRQKAHFFRVSVCDSSNGADAARSPRAAG